MHPDRFRAALEAFLADEARHRIGRWRADPAAGDPALVLARHRFIDSAEAIEALGELHERGRVTPDEAGALAGHLRRIARERAFASIRRSLRDLEVREVEVAGHGLPFRVVARELFTEPRPDRRRAREEALLRAARAAAPVLRERRALAEEAASALGLSSLVSPDAGPDRAALIEQAEAALAGTQALLEEGLDWLRHRQRVPAREAFDLLLGLRAPDLDDVFPAKDRYRRLGAFARGLGLEGELARRVRVDASHGSADPRARLAFPKPPFEVRIGPSFLELGALSELAAASATGRALAAALAHPELPVEHRYPLEGTVSRAMGSLLSQWAFDDGRLLAARRGPRPVLDHARRLAAFTAALSIRLAASAVLCPKGASDEEVAEAMHRAIGLPAAPEIAVVALAEAHGSGAAARLRGELSGLALWAGLRERFDEDWYRNPEARDVFRGAGERGGRLSVEALMAELGVAPAESTGRLAEWFRA
jgi:hypothetical protein